ncbi:ATP-binding protein [Pseudomonas aeruginosa]
MSFGYGIATALNKVFRTNVQHYCQLETSSGKETVVTKDGGLLTVLEIKGTSRIVGGATFGDMLRTIEDRLTMVMKAPGHRMQFVFRRDPLNSKEGLRESIQNVLRVVNHLQLDLDTLVKERSNFLATKTVFESCHLVLQTTAKALPKDELKDSTKARLDKAAKNGGLRPGERAQSPAVELPDIEERHTGFIAQIMSTLSEIKLVVQKLTVHEYLLQLRRQITVYDTSEKWRAYLPGDPLPLRLVEESSRHGDLSHFMYPDIAYQLFSREPRQDKHDPTMVDLGDWKIAPFLVDQRPQNPKPFQDLFTSIDSNIPYQVSLTFDSGHERITQAISRKKTFASFVAWASGQNKLIRDAAEELLFIANSQTLVSGQISFCTWGRDVEQAKRNRSRLKSAVEAWGQMQVIEERGDPIEAWLNTLPGYSAEHLATPLPLRIVEAIGMSPITRPVSPWDQGPLLYRTIDGKLFPFMPGSKLQAANMEVVFAPPGMGKSFYLAAANTALLCRPGNEVLPRIGIIDIGFSSENWVNLVRDALPEHMKNQAQAFRMDLTDKFAVNFFDTPLGCQQPLSVDKEFVVNMMTLLCTPAGREKPIDRLSELVTSLVDEMYSMFSEHGNSVRLYEPGISTLVDEAIESTGLKLQQDQEVSWWKIVHHLAEHELYPAALKAQTFAVPTISDATDVLNRATVIKDAYGTATVDGHELLTKFLNQMIVSAIKDFPMLAKPTKFSLGEARIVSIDLMAVAQKGSPQALKRTAVMYMLARNIICKDFYRKVEHTIDEIPAAYKEYHRKIIERDETLPKKLCMDEYHRTSASPAVREQAITDMREGRKYDVHVSFVSQMLDDFGDEVLKLVNNILIFSKGMTSIVRQQIIDKFTPSPDAIKMMDKWVTGPTAEGSHALYIGQVLSDSDGSVEQVLRLTLGPTEVWAYTTKAQDVSLRRRLVTRIGLSNALKVLSTAYPNGSATADILKLVTDNKLRLDELGEDSSLFDVIADKLIKEHAVLIDPMKIRVAG